MKKLLTTLLLIGLLIFNPIFINGQTFREGVEYVKTDDIIFAWDISSEASRYEVIATWIDPTNEFEYDLGETTNTQITVSRPRTGHFKFKVRACSDSECSEWSESTDPTKATVDSQPKGWWVFWKVPPPTGPVIE